MSDSAQVPSVDDLRRLHTEINCIIRLSTFPPGAQDWGEKVSLMMSVGLIEAITTKSPFLVGSVSTVRGWPAGTMNALVQLRKISTAVLKRWGLTRYEDLPPYPEAQGGAAGDPIPDFPLVFVGDEIEVFRWATNILREAIEWSLNLQQSADGGQHLPSADEESDDYPSADTGWITPVEARSLARAIGIPVQLQTIRRHKDAGEIKSKEGGANSSYLVQRASFDRWVIDWWTKQKQKGKKGES
jgi:hypothetical protein